MLTMSRMTDHIIKHVLVESQRTWYESFSVESGSKKRIPRPIIFNQKFRCIFTNYICCIYQGHKYIQYISNIRKNMMVFKYIKVNVNV